MHTNHMELENYGSLYWTSLLVTHRRRSTNVYHDPQIFHHHQTKICICEPGFCTSLPVNLWEMCACLCAGEVFGGLWVLVVVWGCVCGLLCARVCVFVCVCACACMCLCVRACV